MTDTTRPSRAEAEAAVRTLLAYVGDDPDREGLRDTPRRFVKAYDDWFAGYRDDPAAILERTFEQVGGYDDIVLLRNIRVESHCEHHVAPMLGTAHVAYLPSDRVVGLSKLARLVNAFARRLQSQETLTEQIARAIEAELRPRGVAVIIEATHQCISTRGTHQDDVSCVTRTVLGAFAEDERQEARLMAMLR